MDWNEFVNTFPIQLNQQQQEAVQSTEGAVLLLAVPGSGKTTVLVTRLGYMIYCRNIQPESILTVTYTVAATKDICSKLLHLSLSRKCLVKPEEDKKIMQNYFQVLHLVYSI